MTDEPQEIARPTGDAAWKAHREDLDKRNAAARKKATGQPSAAESAAAARGRRLALAEEMQLQALNRRIDEDRSGK